MADTAKNKRRVKNPETFRERATKAAAQAEKPAQPSRLRRAASITATPLRPVSRAGKRVASVKPLRPVGKLLHWVGLVIWPRYFRNSWQELRTVTWPSWKESRRLTYAVLAFAVVFGGAIALVDWGLDKVFKDILLK